MFCKCGKTSRFRTGGCLEANQIPTSCQSHICDKEKCYLNEYSPVNVLLHCSVCAVMQSRDPSTNVVLLEDAAAVLGVIMAAGCMGLTSLTGKQKHMHRHVAQVLIATHPLFLLLSSLEMGCKDGF